MNTTQTPLLHLDGVRVHFPVTTGVVLRRAVGRVRAVDGVDLRLLPGQALGLVGESGSGKTTLGRTIVGLIRPTDGSVEFEGRDVWSLRGRERRRVRRRVQMVFQDPYASLDPRMSVESSIAEPLEIHRIGTRGDRRRRVAELLDLVGLRADYASRYPHELSGGQRQRVGIARALALGPDLIVADEPVSALDVSIQAQIVNLLQQLRRDLGLATILIAHDLAVVRHVSDVIAVMYLGRIVELAEARELHRDPRHPYTIALLSAVPIPDPRVETTRGRIVLRGDIPSPTTPPSGCPFHTRCWLRERLGNPEECEFEQPPLRTFAPGHIVACHFAEESTAGAASLSSGRSTDAPSAGLGNSSMLKFG
jgi:peptide/nickel transport system ATP-binding protein